MSPLTRLLAISAMIIGMGGMGNDNDGFDAYFDPDFAEKVKEDEEKEDVEA